MFGLFKHTSPELKFTKQYFKKLKEEVKDIELVELSELMIKTKHNGKDLTHYLNNAYAEYLQDKDSFHEVFDRHMKSALTLYQPDQKFSHSKIVPSIKDWRYLEELKRIRPNDEIEYLYEKYNDELFIFYAQDTEHSISYLIKDNIEEYNINTEDLRATSIENLLNILPEIQSHGENGYFMLTAGGDYEASLILEESIWTKENFKVKGEIVIAVPARDLVLITGNEDREGLKRLQETIAEINQTGSYLVSDKLFIWGGGKFEVYDEYKNN